MLGGCSSTGSSRSFEADVKFLQAHQETIVLSTPDGQAKVAVVPAYQGRVMTSTAQGDSGHSLGFLKYDRIASSTLEPQINVYGGEDRFWLGPEGGQFSIFFPPGVEQTFANWRTPACIDSEPYAVASRTADRVTFTHRATLINASGATFDLRIDRSVGLVSRDRVLLGMGMSPNADLRLVAYESANSITNVGAAAWTRDTGLLSIWILGMYPPSLRTRVVIPTRMPMGASLTGILNDAYFGPVPDNRLRVIPSGNTAPPTQVIIFDADGEYRSKIGIAPRGAVSTAASWDPDHGVLTVISFTVPQNPADYVNSMWGAPQASPFAGDVVNAYNDGPPGPGLPPLGPFYELESSSPAAALAPGESMIHIQRTVHFEGARSELDTIARRLLGVSLEQIELAR